MTQEQLVSHEEIKQAWTRVRPHIHETPLLTSRKLSELVGVPCLVKAECMQRSGSFKVRGAFNNGLQLSKSELAAGLLTYSSGNHGQAVSYVASKLGTQATIVMPVDAPEIKRSACLEYGAKIEFAGTTSSERHARALEIQQQTGATLVEPFNSRATIAGQGTLGLEVLAQNPDIKNILVPIGGGGLISGVLAALKPSVRVIGVEPELAMAMTQSLKNGSVTEFKPGATLADGLKPVRPGQLNFLHSKQLNLETCVVTEEAIKAGMRFAFERLKLVLEPSGAATIGALLTCELNLQGVTVVVLSGGNVDPKTFKACI